MSTEHMTLTRRERLAGKWQVPLFVFSVVLLGAALLQDDSEGARGSLEKTLRQIHGDFDQGRYDDVIAVAGKLLAEGELPPAARGQLHHLIAKSHLARAQRTSANQRGAGSRIVEEFRLASASGLHLSGEDFRDVGLAWEWQGQFAAALDAYREALSREIDDAGALRMRIFEILRDRLSAPDEVLLGVLEENLAEGSAATLDQQLWSLEQGMELLHEAGRTTDAQSLLDRHSKFADEPRSADEFSYLRALFDYRSDRGADAERALRNLLNRVATTDHVRARAGWLLGRIILEDRKADRSDEARTFFENVIKNYPTHPYAAASQVGKGEALAKLGRHDEAIEAFLMAKREMDVSPPSGLLRGDHIRAALGVLAEVQRRTGDLETALAYIHAVAQFKPEDPEQELTILQELAQTRVALGEALRSGQITEKVEQGGYRKYFAEASEAYLQIGALPLADRRRATESAWRAAELQRAAENPQEAARLFIAFADRWPDDPLTPRALLEAGNLSLKAARYDSATELFRRLGREFPATLEASRAMVPLTRCLLNAGPEGIEQAEPVLRTVLEDMEAITPQAPEFADALFLLGEVVMRRGEPERAITILEESMARYPEDSRVWSTTFLLADAYRKSAQRLRAQAEQEVGVESPPAPDGEYRARLGQAARLYRQLIDTFELRDPTTASALERVYVRLALLYEADCYFETRDLQTALRLYEQITVTLRESVHALSAYVQIVNCHVFLGSHAEARAALARAMVLAEAMSPAAFAVTGGPQSQESWKEYLEWLGDSDLF